MRHPLGTRRDFAKQKQEVEDCTDNCATECPRC
jgi:hypothetical protein